MSTSTPMKVQPQTRSRGGGRSRSVSTTTMLARCKRIGSRCLLLLALMLVAAAPLSASANDIRTQVSSYDTYVGAPVTMYVEVNGTSAGSVPEVPEVDGIDIQAIGSPSRSSQVTIINGRRSEKTTVTYAYRLTPRKAKSFQIPSFTVRTANGQQQTQPFIVLATTSETGDLMFAEVAGQKESIFIGEPLDVTLKIWLKPFTDRRLDVTLSPDQMWQMVSQDSTQWGGFRKTIEDMAAERRVPQGREVLRANGDGVDSRYYLYEIDATIYPKAAGLLDTTDIQVVADYPTQLGKSRDPFDSMLGGSMFGDDPFFKSAMSPFRRSLTITGARPVVAQPEVFDVTVEALPTDNQPADFRGAVGNYAIGTHATPGNVAAGDPVTLQIGVRGTGPMQLVQAPPLAVISELSKDFKVSDEPLPGVVDGDTKVFVTTIRPREEGVTQVPAIPFSFFDPATRSYHTVYSDPIAIKVSPAETLSLTAIVGETSNGANVNRATSPLAAFELTNYAGDNVLQMETAPNWNNWLAWALTIPVLFITGLCMIRICSSWMARLSTTEASIRNADSPDDIKAALTARLITLLGSETLADVLHQRATSLPATLQQRVVSLMNDCDQAVFSGLSISTKELTSQAEALLDEVRQLLKNAVKHAADDELSFSKTRSQSTQTPRRHLPIFKLWPTVRTTIAAACLIGAMGLFGGWFYVADGAGADEGYDVARVDESTPVIVLTEWQQQQLLNEANTAYDSARAIEGAAEGVVESRIAYEQASKKYQMLVDNGLKNSRLLFNLANTQLQLGNVEVAISNYEEAKRLNPLNYTIHKNLKAATRVAAMMIEAVG